MTPNTPVIHLTPRRQAVPAGFATTPEVLVRISAPDAQANALVERPPLHLALVIDRSGSMSGQPLEEAKNAASFIIQNLSAHDRASLVVFDEHVQTLVPLVDMSHRTTLLAAIKGIHSGGSTNLHGGWLAGAETLATAARPNVLSRVILLSDGCANNGLKDEAAIARQCAEMAGAGVTTSTYGLGHHFNEALMISMARSGHGNSYYGETAADLLDPFREEFALLNALFARHASLQVTPAPGVQVEMLNDYAAAPAGGWRLPDLAHGAEAWALLRLTVPAANDSALPLELLSAQVAWQSMDGEVREPLAAALSLPAVPPALFGALVEDALVLRRLAEVNAAKLQDKARAAAQRRDWQRVDQVLAEVTALGADNPWIANVVKELKQLAGRRDHAMFAKEASYSAQRMTTRATAPAEGLEDSLDIPSFLRRKTRQGKAEPGKPTAP